MEASHNKLRVLVAEDNSTVLQETRNLLRDEFELVAAVENGLRLIAAAEEFKPDIVVTDINMPELNGIEAGRQILALGCCKNIVVLSVSNSPEIVRLAFEAGIRGYVLKENAGEELISAIYATARGKVFRSSGIDSVSF
jgi:DNA-binding NarL/FixJ family response regulator